MRSASVIKRPIAQLLLTVLLFCGVVTNAQQNSPSSRYGWGSLVPSTPIATRGMGGIGVGYVDYDARYDFKYQYPHSQTVNFLNPASYAKLKITSFDLGLDFESQVLSEKGQTDKYKATYANISYVQLGIPLSRKKNFAMVLGLKPVSNVSYQIQSFAREANPETGNSIDSTLTFYQGTGGSYQFFAGLGKSFGKFSFGINTGYFFGTKDFSTRKEFINDTVTYYKGNNETKINFGGIFFQPGIQFSTRLSPTMRLVLGATAQFKTDYSAHKDVIRDTYVYDANGGLIPRDTVYKELNVPGTVTFPGSYSGGFTLEKVDKWLVGFDYTTSGWDDFRIFGQKDSVASNWKIKFGGQVVPDAFGTNFWGRVAYRAGFNYGPNYFKFNNKQSMQYAVTLGFGLPVRPNRFSNQYSTINLGLEFGRNGDNNTALKENLFRLSVGFTLSDLWFVKRKYD
ncbi:outer membrane protein transport protein [Flavihumibacter profundi]|uniref:outer membrane protein transport protein n=1 Tax=Flavihumibacter profundi TaxID=2716883 RepID=UPI001CC77104|nr:outer membrane protein transport protein [Flavihumibacter profundi]MBZ5858843.1 outer membrane protein transport protein [Flavihumibacter profundi]